MYMSTWLGPAGVSHVCAQAGSSCAGGGGGGKEEPGKAEPGRSIRQQPTEDVGEDGGAPPVVRGRPRGRVNPGRSRVPWGKTDEGRTGQNV